MNSGLHIERHKTREVKIGNVTIGGNNDIAIQSMCNTKTSDVKSTVNQILQLEKAGCQIVRATIPDLKSAKAIKDIKKEITIPLVGDIHFDYKMALAAIENGIDKIRINPGNIGGKQKTLEVIRACKERNIPIRLGVNSGSLERDLVSKYKGVTPDGIVESMIRNLEYFEEENFHDLVLSLKSTNVLFMIDVYRKISKLVNYPLHLGVTEAGSYRTGSIKSSVGIGTLLAEGIGDTLRVSLTGDVTQEIIVAKEIMKSLNIRSGGINIISCPTCGRTDVDLAKIVDEVERRIEQENINANLNVAIMGCAVNGPGESREADIGIACGKGEALLFVKGEIVKKVREEYASETLIEEIKKLSGF
ncbi:MAG: flavodoxin-dependent (E)-4-hydroxy-3-methylbut-2-enyl-diphosphate synthase [Candidatus Delongbacteria bacterium]|nr:flavodoxin-dependent (E)-4-hydroxy-3-methylbut-2-enyl-diphosphate synthase [Candidatus Delongbacteria bacterium]MBN2836095.1 flavodoxin-dependent (E)-4-hydroxy-3-methylbut-2-enyl-diphosphate synthase [Candidatus Delongbacteria bacterium]